MSNMIQIVLIGEASGEQVGEYMSPVVPRVGETIELNDIEYTPILVKHVAEGPCYSQLWGGARNALLSVEIIVMMNGEPKT